MPLLMYYYNIFYKRNVNEKRIKIIPKEITTEFNGISFAHLVMGDGNFLKEKNIIHIYINSFAKEDVELLSSILYNNLSIKSKVCFIQEKSIYINYRK